MVPFWDPNKEGYEGPLESDNPWDVVILNGFRSPGIATVKCTPQLKIDLPKKTSTDGGPAIERGHVPAKIEVVIKVWTPDQWTALQELLNNIWRKPGEGFRLENQDGVPVSSSTKVKGKDGKTTLKAKPAITIAHPCCALWGVTAMLLESPESPEPAPEIGAKIVRLRGMQYIAPSKRPTTKKAAGSGVKLTPEFKQAHNAVPPDPPSKTDAVPRLPPKPNTGGS